MDILDSLPEAVTIKKEDVTARATPGMCAEQLQRWKALRGVIADAEAELDELGADICVKAEAERLANCAKGKFASSVRLSEEIIYVWFCTTKFSKEQAEHASSIFKDSFVRYFARTRSVKIDAEKLTAALDNPGIAEAIQALQRIGVLTIQNIFQVTDAFCQDYALDKSVREHAATVGVKPTAYLKMQRKTK